MKNSKGQFIKGHKPTKEMLEKNKVAHLGVRKSQRTEFRKGHLSAFSGRKHTKASKEKMRKAHTGKVLSEDHKKKIGQHTPWNKDKKCPQLKGGNSGSFKKGQISIWKGRKHSEETRKKMRGKNNYNWKGGISPLSKRIRMSFEYRQWRSDIFTRDDYTCQLCGQRGGVLVVDHYPKKFSDIFDDNKITSMDEARACEEFWNINNGRTLCEKCHHKIPCK